MKLLKELAEAHSVSGNEDEVRKIIKRNIKADTIYYDGLGSIIGQQNEEKKSIALISHMDEVGFIVKYIDNMGFIYFDPIGSFFEQTLLNQKVKIKNNDGKKIIGLIGSISPHALSLDQKKRPIKIPDMFIDIGVNSREEVEKQNISIGNFISLFSEFTTLNNKFMCKAFDNRAGVYAMLKCLNKTQNEKITIYGVGSVQEEVGLRGAQTSAQLINPDIAIALDVIVPGDSPHMEEKDFQTKIGKGPSVCIFDKRTIPNQNFLHLVKKIAIANNIPYQLYSIKTGATDAGRYNVMGKGRPVISISIPCRYIHSNNALIDKTDINNTILLITKLIDSLTPELIENIEKFNIE